VFNFSRQLLFANSDRGTVFSVRSVPSCYKQDKLDTINYLENCLGSVVVKRWLLSPGIVREPEGMETSAVGSRYQATTSEDCNRLRRYSVSYSDFDV
jgi:hypothetical protein